MRRDVPSPVCPGSQDPPLSPHLAERPLPLTITPRLLFLIRKSIKKLFILKLLYSLSLVFYSACSTPLCYLVGPCCLNAGEPCYHIRRARCSQAVLPLPPPCTGIDMPELVPQRAPSGLLSEPPLSQNLQTTSG